MRLAMIVAMDLNRVIGKAGGLPWRLPADLRHFREITMSKPIIMGRKTFESIGRVLRGRTHIILTHRQDFVAPREVLVVHDVAAALALVQPKDESLLAPARAAGLLNERLVPEEAVVIGGAAIYRAFFPHAERLYLTIVHGHFEGDTWFPEYDSREWQETARADYHASAEHPVPYSFITLDRKGSAGR